MSARLLPTLLLTLAALTLTAASAQAADSTWRRSAPLNIAHNGGEDEAPSGTMYAFRQAVRAGTDVIDFDLAVTKDKHVVANFGTTVDSRSGSRGPVSSYTLAQLKKLDNAYWYSASAPHYGRGKAKSAYLFRGVATGKKKPPKGYKAADFRFTTLSEVLRAFPKKPLNLEIKARTTAETPAEFQANARVIARELLRSGRRDVIVASFDQSAVELFHSLAPKIGVAPGTAAIADFLLEQKNPGPGVAAIEAPLTYPYQGAVVEVTNQPFVDQAHAAGYPWFAWFNYEAGTEIIYDIDGPTNWTKLVGLCVDGIISSRPAALAKTLRGAKSPAACKQRP